MSAARSSQGGDHTLRRHADPFGGGGTPKETVVDYSDVFGGPPRRLSGTEDGARACAPENRRERGRSWSSSVAEKPVYAGAGSPAYRRHLRDDFFSDIFRGGGESASSSPRKKDLDSYPSYTSGSRALIPLRSQPPASDVFNDGAPLSASISYSSRLAKSFDYSSFRSPTRCVARRHQETIPDLPCLSSSSDFCAPTAPDKATRIKDYLRYDADASFRQSPPPSKDSQGSSGRFHFSIFKWASKAVPTLRPSTLRDVDRSGSRLDGASAPFSGQGDLPLDADATPIGQTLAFMEEKMEDKDLSYELGLAEKFDPGLPAKESTSFSVEEQKHKPKKDLRHVQHESSAREGNENVTRQSRGEDHLAGNLKTMKKDNNDNVKIREENSEGIVSSDEICGSPATLEGNVLPSRTREKVMEFIKVFNQEAPQKPGRSAESQTRRPKVKDKARVKAVDYASSHVSNADEDDISNCSVPSSAPVSSLKRAEIKSSLKYSYAETASIPFPGTGGNQASLSDSNVDGLDASFGNVEKVHIENIKEFMVEELSQVHYEVTESDLHQDEIDMKVADTRIQEWLEGKEGNIRSLLSTLQYVLWPESGWKLVPLVNIIEASSVRRTYQKALLCLHPDKLQQKGAEKHQKYIAEKVFDILQEAWDHFNSMSSL